MDPTQTVNGGQAQPEVAPVAPVVQPPVAQVSQPAAPVVPEIPVAPTPPITQELPVGTSQRTSEQFEKMKDSNRRLYEANQLLQQQIAQKAEIERQFAPIQQAPRPVQQQAQTVNPEQFIETDPFTGEQFVNETRIRSAIEEANARATRAETAVQEYIKQQNVEKEVRQTEEAYRAYPELNPQGGKYDAELTRRTRRILLDSMVSPADYGGRPFTFREAADLAKVEMGGQVSGVAPVVQAQPAVPNSQPQQQTVSTEGLDQKQQAALSVQGSSSSAQQAAAASTDEAQIAQLRMQTRQGGDTGTWALAQRLAKVEHSGTPKSSTEA